MKKLKTIRQQGLFDDFCQNIIWYFDTSIASHGAKRVWFSLMYLGPFIFATRPEASKVHFGPPKISGITKGTRCALFAKNENQRGRRDLGRNAPRQFVLESESRDCFCKTKFCAFSKKAKSTSGAIRQSNLVKIGRQQSRFFQFFANSHFYLLLPLRFWTFGRTLFLLPLRFLTHTWAALAQAGDAPGSLFLGAGMVVQPL